MADLDGKAFCVFWSLALPRRLGIEFPYLLALVRRDRRQSYCSCLLGIFFFQTLFLAALASMYAVLCVCVGILGYIGQEACGESMWGVHA